jgi:hypothetical protein
MVDSFNIRRDNLLILLDNIKSRRDHIKIRQAELLALLNNIKSTRDHIKIRQAKLLALPDIFTIRRIVLKNGRYFTCTAG